MFSITLLLPSSENFGVYTLWVQDSTPTPRRNKHKKLYCGEERELDSLTEAPSCSSPTQALCQHPHRYSSQMQYRKWNSFTIRGLWNFQRKQSFIIIQLLLLPPLIIGIGIFEPFDGSSLDPLAQYLAGTTIERDDFVKETKIHILHAVQFEGIDDAGAKFASHRDQHTCELVERQLWVNEVRKYKIKDSDRTV